MVFVFAFFYNDDNDDDDDDDDVEYNDHYAYPGDSIYLRHNCRGSDDNGSHLHRLVDGGGLAPGALCALH